MSSTPEEPTVASEDGVHAGAIDEAIADEVYQPPDDPVAEGQ